MLVFGHSGYPVLLFPTSMGRYYQNKDFGLIDAGRWYIDNGLVRIYCIDSIDELSWYNKSIHPADRVRNHIWYDKMLRDELVPRMQSECSSHKIAVGGASFGAYHATNFAFRYPGITGYLFNMGGAFNIRARLDGFFNDDAYFHNPPDYLPDLNHPALWEMGIVLGVGENDFCLQANMDLSGQLTHKSVNHWLDIRPGANHDWPVWKEMFPAYLSTIFQ